MKLIYLLIAFLVSACNNPVQVPASKKQPVATAPEQPDTTVALQFINSYVRFTLSESKTNPPLTTWIKTNPLLTASFKARYQAMVDEATKKDPEVGLDFDPILDAQDLPEEGFVIRKANSANGYVMVSGKDWKDFEVTMKLVEQNGKWLVDGSGYINIPQNQRARR